MISKPEKAIKKKKAPVNRKALFTFSLKFIGNLIRHTSALRSDYVFSPDRAAPSLRTWGHFCESKGRYGDQWSSPTDRGSCRSSVACSPDICAENRRIRYFLSRFKPVKLSYLSVVRFRDIFLFATFTCL